MKARDFGLREIIFATLLCALSLGLLESLGAPHSLGYVLDALGILMLVLLLGGKNKRYALSNSLLMLQVVMMVLGVIVALLYGVRLPLILWAVRNNYRYLIFFVACIYALKYEDVAAIHSLLNRAEYINFLLVLIEFLVLGFKQDNLGGLFGVGDGVNGILNCFLVVQTIHHLYAITKREESYLQVISSIGMSVLIAVLSELKYYFIELLIIVLLVLVWNMLAQGNLNVLIKTMLVGIFVLSLLNFAISELVRLYPVWEDYFSLNNIIETSTKADGYTGHDDLNRISGIQTINKTIFADKGLRQWFGLGLGATEFCEGRPALTSEFYYTYRLLHYTYFSATWIYLETGYVGLGLYLLSFISVLFYVLRRAKYSVGFEPAILSVLTMGLIVYNQSMRTQAAYLIYACLALAYVRSSGGVIEESDSILLVRTEQ